MGKCGKKMSVCIRKYQSSDADGLAKLFWESVRNGTGHHYTYDERVAWAPDVPEVEGWHRRLNSMMTLVAEDDDGLAGFMTLELDGHIDLAYVRSDLIGKGIASQLYTQIEALANANNIKMLYSEASHLARRFFEKEGWELVETQQVESSGRFLTNHRMRKCLG